MNRQNNRLNLFEFLDKAFIDKPNVFYDSSYNHKVIKAEILSDEIRQEILKQIDRTSSEFLRIT